MTSVAFSPPPLTTTFTPAPSCLSSYNYFTIQQGYGYTLLGPSMFPTQCYPPGWKPLNSFYYSPGVCPQSYSTVSTSLNVIGTVTETVAICCPSGYLSVSGTDMDNLDYIYFPCKSSYQNVQPSYVSVPFSENGGPSMTGTVIALSTGAIDALSIQVRFQASDTFLANPTPSSKTTSASTTSGTSTSSSQGLSNGRGTGIGVGAALGAIMAYIGLGARLVW